MLVSEGSIILLKGHIWTMIHSWQSHYKGQEVFPSGTHHFPGQLYLPLRYTPQVLSDTLLAYIVNVQWVFRDHLRSFWSGRQNPERVGYQHRYY